VRNPLQPVVVDAAVSKGCMEHAEYMKLDRNTDAMAGLNAHHQRPGLLADRAPRHQLP
jgi:hypothetical protein